MSLSRSGFVKSSVAVLIFVATMTATVWANPGSHRTTSELNKDLRATKLELKNFNSLQSKLDSSARQSSNAARQSVIADFQEFMGECIVRREGDLGEEITIKQHGKDVKTGTTDSAKAGNPVSVKNSGKGLGVYSTSNGDRMRQLSNMKSIYVGAKNNSRPAIEKQNDAFERYTETISKFGQQLQWGVNGLEDELTRRENEAKAKEQAAKDAVSEDKK